MFKKISVLFCLLLTSLFFINFSVDAQQPTKILLDGRALQFDVPSVNIDGRTMVPMRVIFQELGATINWDEPTKAITATKNGLAVRTVVGEMEIEVNGNRIAMDVAPTIVDGRTLVPVRFISEVFGADVTWDEHSRIVYITTDATFEEFLYNFTQTIVTGATTQEEKLRKIYDFIVLNFSHDGAAIDGSTLPPIEAIPPISTISHESGIRIEDSIHLRTVITYFMFLRIEEALNDLAAILELMVRNIGLEAIYVIGFYVNPDDTRQPHAWTAIKIYDNWYFFDPQMEASWYKENQNNYTCIPYHWYRQNITDPLTISRYRYNEARFQAVSLR